MTTTILFLFLVIISNSAEKTGVGYGLYTDQEICREAFAHMRKTAKIKDVKVHTVIANCEPIEITLGKAV